MLPLAQGPGSDPGVPTFHGGTDVRRTTRRSILVYIQQNGTRSEQTFSL